MYCSDIGLHPSEAERNRAEKNLIFETKIGILVISYLLELISVSHSIEEELKLFFGHFFLRIFSKLKFTDLGLAL